MLPAEFHQFLKARFFGESDYIIVGLVHLHKGSRLESSGASRISFPRLLSKHFLSHNGLLIVRDLSLVARSDFREESSRLSHNVRYSESSSDLHKLSAADDDLFARSECRKYYHGRRSIVIDYHRVFSTCQLCYQISDEVMSGTSRAFGHVILKIRISA